MSKKDGKLVTYSGFCYSSCSPNTHMKPLFIMVFAHSSNSGNLGVFQCLSIVLAAIGMPTMITENSPLCCVFGLCSLINISLEIMVISFQPAAQIFQLLFFRRVGWLAIPKCSVYKCLCPSDISITNCYLLNPPWLTNYIIIN